MISTKLVYDRRIVKSGQVVEIIEYERPIIKSFGKDEQRSCNSDKGRSIEANEEDKKRHREDTLARARQNIRRLINANVYRYEDSESNLLRPVFMTLTFADNIQDLKEANIEFRGFVKRLSYRVFGKESGLKYVVVPEFQRRGAVHYHLVVFNLPYFDSNIIADIWGQGFIKVNAIDEVDNVGAYVVKYMNKDMDDERLHNQKCYFSSRGLFKPEEVIYRTGSLKEKEIEKVAASLSQNMVYQVKHDSDYYGSITYKQYNLSRNKL